MTKVYAWIDSILFMADRHYDPNRRNTIAMNVIDYMLRMRHVLFNFIRKRQEPIPKANMMYNCMDKVSINIAMHCKLT